MRVPRLYLPSALTPGTQCMLDERAHRHAVQVLRLKQGERLRVFNGDGGEYPAELIEVERRRSAVLIGEREEPLRESRLSITLVQGIAKGDHMDYALQKATELGVAHIQPVFTERSVVQLKAKRLEAKRTHWQGVLISACEQCGRNVIPTLGEPAALASWLQARDTPLEGYVLDPQSAQPLARLAPAATAPFLLIGPEGGLSEKEIELSESSGFRPVSLGPRILRTETAGMAAVTALQVLWGDLGV